MCNLKSQSMTNLNRKDQLKKKLQTLQVCDLNSIISEKNSVNSLTSLNSEKIQNTSDTKIIKNLDFILNSKKQLGNHSIFKNISLFGLSKKTKYSKIDLLFNYKSQKTAENINKDDLINFIFEKNLKWENLPLSNLKEGINSLLFNYLSIKNIEKYTFTTSDLKDSKVYLNDGNLSILNPSNLNHFICLKFKDFIYMSKKDSIFEKNENTNMIKSERIKCILCDYVLVLETKFPFYDFFFRILFLVMNLFKLERLKIFPDYESTGNIKQFVRNLDSEFLLEFLEKKMKNFFFQFSNQGVPFFEKTLLINWSNFQIFLSIPRRSYCKFVEVQNSFLTILRYTSWLNFIKLYSCIMQEKSIIFVCKSREILSKYISFFTSILKPFIWDFPVIYFLDKSNFDYLNSPVPIIIGIDTSTIEFKFQINLSDITNPFIFYYVGEDNLEKGDYKFIFPSFKEKIWKLQKKYRKLRNFIKNKKNYDKKNFYLYTLGFLRRFKKSIESITTDEILNFKLYSKNKKTIVKFLKKKFPKDSQFIKNFGETLLFSSYLQKLKNIIEYEAQKRIQNNN